MNYEETLRAVKNEAKAFATLTDTIEHFIYWQETYREWVKEVEKLIRKAVREGNFWELKNLAVAYETRQNYVTAYTEVLNGLYPLGIAELDREEAERVGA